MARKDMFILEEGMEYPFEYNTVYNVLYIFNPWNGALLMTLRGVDEYTSKVIMRDLNTGVRHIHSEWAWHGTHGVHYPVIK